MLRKFKLKSNGLNKSMPSLIFDNNNAEQQHTAMKKENSVHENLNIDDDMSLIEGNVHLRISLPNGTDTELDVDAKTAMMDLLVQVTTANGIHPGGMYLKAPLDRPPGYVHYKPNTPIGKLNCSVLEVVPKFDLRERAKKQLPKTANQPFEPTIRIQVNLPKNQKTVLRVNPNSNLDEIFGKICTEKKISNCQLYELRSTKRVDTPLDLNLKLADLGTVDFTLVSATNADHRKSTNDLLYQDYTMQQQERGNIHQNQPTPKKGIFGCFNKKNKKQAPSPSANGGSAAIVNRSAVQGPMTSSSSNAHGGDVFSPTDNGATRPKKRSAPKPPDEMVPKHDGPAEEDAKFQGKLAQAPLSAYAVVDAPSTSAAAVSQRSRRNSAASSGYHDGGSSVQSTSPVGGVSRINAQQAADAADDKSSTSGASGSGSLSSPPSVMTHRPPPGVAAVIVMETRASRVASDTSDVSVSGKKKQRAPQPPGSPVHVSEKMDSVLCVAVSDSDFAASNNDDGQYPVYSDKSSKPNLSPVPNADKKKSIVSDKQSMNDSSDVISKAAKDVQSPYPIRLVEESTVAPPRTVAMAVDPPVTSSSPSRSNKVVEPVVSGKEENAINDGRKSWLHCSGSSPVHDVDDLKNFAESVGQVPPFEEQYSDSVQSDSKKVDKVVVPPSPLLQSSGVYSKAAITAVPQSVQYSSPGQKNVQIIRDNDRQRYPPSMSIKSFEDEYYSKKSTVFTKNEEIPLKSVNVATLERAKPKPNVEDGIKSNKRESLSATTLFDRQSIKPENEQLLKEYETLQTLFTEWQSCLNRNESVIKSGGKLSSDEIQQFQRAQTKMMDQHQLVQKLCSEQDNGVSSATLERSKNSAQVAAQPTSSTKMSPSRNKRSSYPVSIAPKTNGDIITDENIDRSSIVRPTQIFGSNSMANKLNATNRQIPESKFTDYSVEKFSPTLKPSYTKEYAKPVNGATKPVALSNQRISTKTDITDNGRDTVPRRSKATADNVDRSDKHLSYRTDAPLVLTTPAIRNGGAATNDYANSAKATAQQQTAIRAVPPVVESVAVATVPVKASQPPAPPPPPPALPPLFAEMKTVKLKSTLERPKSKNDISGDPKDDLMKSIREFGGSGGLRKVVSVPSHIRTLS